MKLRNHNAASGVNPLENLTSYLCFVKLICEQSTSLEVHDNYARVFFRLEGKSCGQTGLATRRDSGASRTSSCDDPTLQERIKPPGRQLSLGSSRESLASQISGPDHRMKPRAHTGGKSTLGSSKNVSQERERCDSLASGVKSGHHEAGARPKTTESLTYLSQASGGAGDKTVIGGVALQRKPGRNSEQVGTCRGGGIRKY